MTPTSSSLAPFSCSYTREVPDLLTQLGCSLILSTYQAGKVILLSPDGDRVVQLARNFAKPMGLAVDEGRIAVATQHEVVVLADAPSLAPGYPNKPDYYDALYVPRATYLTGELDLHDMAWSRSTLWAVNTLFSCLCHIDARYSFTPVWRPPFVSALAPQDRCHLNGLAVEEGAARFVTALGATDTPKGWREDRLGGGVLLDVPTGETVVSGLPMPHSPRLVDGTLYLLTSADGALRVVDVEAGTTEVVTRVPGFARGLAAYGDYLFVGHSRLREQHMFGDLPVAQKEHHAGVVIVHRPSGRVAGALRYHTSCEEIYDVHVLPGTQRPGIVGIERGLHRRGLYAPHAGYWAAPSSSGDSLS